MFQTTNYQPELGIVVWCLFCFVTKICYVSIVGVQWFIRQSLLLKKTYEVLMERRWHAQAMFTNQEWIILFCRQKLRLEATVPFPV